MMIGLQIGKPGRHFIDGFLGRLSKRFHMMNYYTKPSKYGLGDEYLSWLKDCLEDENRGNKIMLCSVKLGSFMEFLQVVSARYESSLSCEAEAQRICTDLRLLLY